MIIVLLGLVERRQVVPIPGALPRATDSTVPVGTVLSLAPHIDHCVDSASPAKNPALRHDRMQMCIRDRRAAFSMLLRALQTKTRPFVTRVPVPLLLPGERSSTEDAPADGLYAGLAALEGTQVWRTDLMIGYVWADEPRATACAVVTGTDAKATATAGAKIAQDFWDARDAFRFGPVTGGLDEMLALAKTISTSPIILADSGDNPTGGGVGDRGDVLAALVAEGWQNTLVAGITDRPAVEACFAAGAEARLRLRIGASLDPQGASIEVDARVIRLEPGADPVDSQAVVQVGGITVVLAAKRRDVYKRQAFSGSATPVPT